MAKISLRDYNREIERLIEGGQLEEAVAHCQHILKTFSMHIETYRLLGKAFLEGRRFTDAADIFQRVLNAVPDDFVSHVGMSIIYDDEGRLDEAIWHMERAFEVQPSNPAIQGELRRLYGRRDGVEPPKIRLSRDALANMYAQGELYNQAIAEIRSVLAEEPSRPDLQVMLTRAYLQAGQKVEAAEMANQLLKKYPYCVDALRVLVEVLPGSSRAENTQVYRQRLRLLDPYSSFVSGSVFASDKVTDSAVNLERLEYMPGVRSTPSQPSWAASLGVKLDDDRKEIPTPAWLNSGEEETPLGSETPGSGPVVQGAEAIPDFLRAAGWTGAEDQSSSAALDFGEEQLPVEEIAKGEMPDWLKSQAPAGLSDQQPAADLADDADLPNWLNGLDVAAGVATVLGDTEPGKPVASTDKTSTILPETPLPDLSASEPAVEMPVSSEVIPDWLSGLDTAPEATASEPFPDTPLADLSAAESSMDVPASAEAIPDWLSGLDAAPETAISEPFPDLPLADLSASAPSTDVPASAEAIPDWLSSLDAAPETTAPEPFPDLSVEQTPDETVAVHGDIPDWLTGLGISAGAAALAGSIPGNEPASQDSPELGKGLVTPPPPAETGEVRPLGIEDDTMAWLEGLAARQGASEEELLTKPEDRSVEMPDWLKGSTAIEPAEGELPPQSSRISWDAGEAPSSAGAHLDPLETKPLPEMQGISHIHEVFPAEDSVVSIPAPEQPQGQELELTVDGLASTEGPSSSPLGIEMPDWLEETPQDQPAITTAAGGIEIPDWLASQETAPASAAESLPGEGSALPAVPGTEATRPLGIEDDTMAWLEGLAARQGASEEELLTRPEDRSVEIPEWLKQPSQAPGHEQDLSSQPEAAGLVEPPVVQAEAATPKPLPQPPVQDQPAAVAQEDVTITTWLKTLDESGAAADIPPAPPPVEPSALAQEDVPDWLKDFEQKSIQPVAVPDEEPTPMEEEHPVPSTGDLPDWLLQPSEPDLQEIAPQPQQAAVDLPGWVAEETEQPVQAAPTAPDEWVPVEAAAETAISPEPQAPAPEVIDTQVTVKQRLKGTGMLSPIPALDKDAQVLSTAQKMLESGQLNEAMKEYTRLIRKGRLLEEVIHDIREAIYRYPVDIIIWQSLGDAYMRANRLQDALDAYTKAEELLR